MAEHSLAQRFEAFETFEEPFDYRAFRSAWRLACAARGIDPATGPTPSQAEAIQRERRNKAKRPFDFLIARMAPPTAADYARPVPTPAAYDDDLTLNSDPDYLVEIDPVDLDADDFVPGVRYYAPRPTEQAVFRPLGPPVPSRAEVHRRTLATLYREGFVEQRQSDQRQFQTLLDRFVLDVLIDARNALRREDIARDRRLKEMHHAQGVELQWIDLTPTLTTSVLVKLPVTERITTKA